MILVVGLGNPGDRYAKTRHNIGFMVIDELKDGEFTQISSDKFHGELLKCGSLLLLKPHTFMNASGISVKSVKDFYKPERIIVIHDDLDLKFGAMKFKFGGSSGGHNGLKSIDALIGNEYERVRIGIGNDKSDTINYVLGKFPPHEAQILPEILTHAKDATKYLIQNDIISTSQKFTRKGAE